MSYNMIITENFIKLQENINRCFKNYFLEARNVEIIAVSKNQVAEKIIPLLEYGHRIFGENRVGEATEKWVSLKQKYPDCELHLIGTLQSNKVKQACELFDVIQTLDRLSLIEALAKEAKIRQVMPKLFIQVNTGREAQKSGVFPEDLEALLKASVENGLTISGLMCIPPVDELAVFHFTMLKNLAKTYHIPLTSMGMSGDYDKALICGTDYIRVGTAIFGER